MSKSDLDTQIRDCIEGFVRDLSSLIRAAALEAVGIALGQGPTQKKRVAGRAGPTAASPRGKKKRLRRSAADLERVATQVIEYVKANAGCKIKEISEALRAQPKDLRRPIQDLFDAKKLKSTGAGRGTQYFLAGHRSFKPANPSGA